MAPTPQWWHFVYHLPLVHPTLNKDEKKAIKEVLTESNYPKNGKKLDDIIQEKFKRFCNKFPKGYIKARQFNYLNQLIQLEQKEGGAGNSKGNTFIEKMFEKMEDHTKVKEIITFQHLINLVYK